MRRNQNERSQIQSLVMDYCSRDRGWLLVVCLLMKRGVELKRTPFARAEPKPGKGPKLKKCAICRTPFQPRSMTHKACGPDCSQALIERDKRIKQSKAQRQERAQDKVKRDSLKSRADWHKEAQAALNKWVREVRDAGKPCISCGRHHQGQLHAGHYLSRGAHPNLALVENNLALQCAPCNVHLSGNQILFRRGLVERIGLAAVEALESDNEPRKYSIEQLQTIKADYLQRIKEAKKVL